MQFSVVIPLYNKVAYISRAVNSVLKQSFQDFEIIVVDDGSTDGGEKIVVAINDSRIRLIRQQNAGVSAARNRGAREAKAALIAFLDADDEWKKDCLTNYEYLTRQFPSCGLYGLSYLKINRQNQVSIPHSLDNFPNNWEGILDNFIKMLTIEIPFYTSSICLYKTLLESIGGFPEGIHAGEDLSVWIKISITYPIAFKHTLSSIYYTDIAGSNSNIISVPDFYLETLLENYVQDQTLQENLRKDLFEFYTSRLIQGSSQLIMNGENMRARNLLLKCKNTQIFKKKWTRWWILSYIPSKFVRQLLALKNGLYQYF
jgi:glycosyltransferase involved in cell wall biosynthesis